MNPVILYGSRYGSAKRYAEALGEREGIPVLPFQQAADLDRFDTIIYIGSLYAGRVTGLSKTMRRKDCAGKRIIILTVGLADGEKEKNAVNIRNHIRKQIPEELFDKAEIFHLRGDIDYRQLSFVHRQMMIFLCRQLSKIPPEKRDEDAQYLISTYGGKVELFDPGRLDQIRKKIKSGSDSGSGDKSPDFKE